MLQLAQRTVAPRSTSVSMSTAVWIVICSDPVTRTPASGLSFAYLRRIDIKPGISCSAIVISLRPQSASWRSATLYAEPEHHRIQSCRSPARRLGTQRDYDRRAGDARLDVDPAQVRQGQTAGRRAR